MGTKECRMGLNHRTARMNDYTTADDGPQDHSPPKKGPSIGGRRGLHLRRSEPPRLTNAPNHPHLTPPLSPPLPSWLQIHSSSRRHPPLYQSKPLSSQSTSLGMCYMCNMSYITEKPQRINISISSPPPDLPVNSTAS